MKSIHRDVQEVELTIYGRVQGVNFRNTIKSFCVGNDVSGYVLNKENGSVLVIAQGSTNALEKLIEFVRSSPGFSRVEKVEFNWKSVKAKYSGFEVIRKSSFFIDKTKSILNLGKFLISTKEKKTPIHVVIIPDGNRRWARERGLNASFGHYTAGSMGHVIELFREAKRREIKYLSLWGFSTENWKRDNREIKAIFDLIINNSDKLLEEAHKNKIRFRHIGRKDRLPRRLIQTLRNIEDETKRYGEFNVQLCLDYGGRDEIIRAVNSLLKSGVKKINEKTFSESLDSSEIPDPDLIIRTSGEKRTSGFMPWQATYAELYFTDVYFPDFDAFEFRKAINSFGKRVRRFGGTAREDIAKK